MSKGIDRIVFGGDIEIFGMRRVNPIYLYQIEGANITITAGNEAARISDGLRASVIEADLQSLCERHDGVQLLTGHGLTNEALLALNYAGLSSEMMITIRNWNADEIAVHFLDARHLPEQPIT